MIETLPPRLRRAVSPYAGIVDEVEECLPTSAEPRLFQASCAVGRSDSLLGTPLGHVARAGGTGRTRAEAAAAAVGEAIERYSAGYVPRGLMVASARDLGEDAVPPERFALFSARQYRSPGFPFRPFTCETRVAWVEGRELQSGRRVFVPAELAYLGSAAVEGERPIAHSTSNGLACAEAEDRAVVTGLFELLERDAFMIVWAGRLSLPRIDSAGIGSRLRETFDRTGLQYAGIDLSVFHDMPAVLGVVRAPAGFLGAVGVGAAAASTIERAWWKALAEAFAVRAAGAKLSLLAGATPPDRVETFDDHILRYAGHDHAAATDFLDASGERTPPTEVAELVTGSTSDAIAALCKRVEAAGSSAYAVDVTSPDVAGLGLKVIRTVAPGLCALDASHSARYLGGRRLYEAAAELGIRAAALREDDLNADPHPFP
jgi:ribosomal protein S12 methylthiotransferase accessory factor